MRYLLSKEKKERLDRGEINYIFMPMSEEIRLGEAVKMVAINTRTNERVEEKERDTTYRITDIITERGVVEGYCMLVLEKESEHDEGSADIGDSLGIGEIKAFLRDKLKERGLKQQIVAKAVGLSDQRVLANWFATKNEPKMSMVVDMLGVLDYELQIGKRKQGRKEKGVYGIHKEK